MKKNNENITNGTTLFSEVMFNIPRHNLITTAAFQLLNANAKAEVEKLLKAGKTSPDNWGGWADQIKDPNPPNDDETTKFLQNANNKKHRTWHFVDLPLKTINYQEAVGFKNDNDVVQTIKKCVLVLRDGSTRFSRVNAIRLLGHLVGDVHQPLHVACGFIDDATTPPTIVFDQQEILDNENVKANSDRGGNRIKLPASGNMHSFWDGSLSGDVGGINLLAAAEPSKEIQIIKKIVSGAKKLGASFDNNGISTAAATPLEDLAQDWVRESAKISLKAYQNLVMDKKDGNNYIVKFKTTKDDYIAKFRPVILKQMKLAARRLADLLNVIFP